MSLDIKQLIAAREVERYQLHASHLNSRLARGRRRLTETLGGKSPACHAARASSRACGRNRLPTWSVRNRRTESITALCRGNFQNTLFSRLTVVKLTSLDFGN
jgi:hypothetical protein